MDQNSRNTGKQIQISENTWLVISGISSSDEEFRYLYESVLEHSMVV